LKSKSFTKCLSYNDAQKVVQEFKIKNWKHYKKLYDAKKLPKGLPSNPPKMYAKLQREKISYINAKILGKKTQYNKFN